MTIRNHVRRTRRIFLVVFAVWVITPLFMPSSLTTLSVVWLLAGIANLVFHFWFERCTCCKSSLANQWPVGRIKWMKPINYCPYCGVSLDEEDVP